MATLLTIGKVAKGAKSLKILVYFADGNGEAIRLVT